MFEGLSDLKQAIISSEHTSPIFSLLENIIFGAGLDVFYNEPVEKNNALLKNNKVLLSPHSATFTNECKSRMSKETIKNIIDFFDNKIDKSMIIKL